jgi:hypothetical protein
MPPAQDLLTILADAYNTDASLNFAIFLGQFQTKGNLARKVGGPETK